MKKQTQLQRGSAVAIAIGLWFIGGARAQLCLDVFLENDSPFLQCADTDFFLAPTDGGFDNLEDPDFDVSALAELDLDEDTFEPEFYGFDDPDLDDAIVEIDFAPPEPEIDDEFDIELELDIDDFDQELAEPIVLETDTFGSIFSDGFESGDVAAWEAESPGTFTFTVSSPDPNVRFNLVGVPGPPLPFAITSINRAADGQSFDLTWRSRPGEKFTVRHSKDLMIWNSYLVEDIDAGAGETTTFEYLIGDVPELVGAGRVYFRVEKR